ncbi:MAG: energy-coupling factor ABC transporter permease [Clostridiales bacterium]|jgi:cobalt/nickel transport system permease protein|nr:energy-coupling factor ABC transporter permease [Clostridiales bacterium]
MHMADALLSAAAGGTMCAVSAASIGYSITKIRKDELSEKKVPIMAVSGAFVFAAQMINFTIPGTGSSGHIGGGILLASLLGGYPALLTISAVLIIQCLFFADGGLLALGCNIFNMGVIPCLLVYPFLVKPWLKKRLSTSAISAASMAAVIIGLQLGAFSVVLETRASGISELPFGTFVLLMQPIHLAIGIVEGAVTAAALCFVYKMRPEILESAETGASIAKTVSLRNVMAALIAVTIAVGGLLSVFASAYPDGLEWSIEKAAGTTELEVKEPFLEEAGKIQSATAFMPDYDYKSAGDEGSSTGTSVAGIAGGVMTFAASGGIALIISALKKKSKRELSASA